MALELGIGRGTPGIANWPVYVSQLLGCAILILLFFQRNRPRTSVAATLFLANAMIVCFALYMRHAFYANASLSHPWVPFQANKLGCLIAALLAPNLGVGLLAIAAHAGSSVWQYEFFSPAIQSHLAFAEPEATLAFGLAGVLTLVARIRRIQADQDAAAIKAQADATKNLAKTILRLRDSMNTPLQAVDLSTTLLDQHSDQQENALKCIKNAVSSLREINLALQEYEKDFKWNPGDESF
jgi:hypothetical protein